MRIKVLIFYLEVTQPGGSVREKTAGGKEGCEALHCYCAD